MKNERTPGSRRPRCLSDLFQCRGALPGAGSFLLFCLFLPPALLGSCRKEALPEPGSRPDDPPPAVDSVRTLIRFQSGDAPVRRLDLFIYGNGGTRPLERHLQLDAIPDTLSLLTPPGEKILVGIANSPHRFNLNALARFDAMEHLSFSFSDDDPAFPVLGGSGGTADHAGEIRLRPLLCRVVLASVANTMDGYELLESPRVRLCDLPDAAEILREKDFRPAELIDAGAWTALPCDIGFFPQEPGTVLWCYPNDTPENVLGTPRPVLEFACEIQGRSCSFEVPLPPLPRGSSIQVELTIDGPDEFRYKIR